MIVDPAQDVGEPGARVSVVQLGRDDERIDGRGAVAAAVSKLSPVTGSASGPVKSSHLGPVGSGAPPAPPPSAQQIERGTRALSLLLDRLSQIRVPDKLADTPEVGSFAQLLTTAALDAKS